MVLNVQTRLAGTFLVQDETSNPLIFKANNILRLRQAMAQAIPGNLASQCSIANFKNGALVIFAANSAIAAKLKLISGGLPATLTRLLADSASQVTAVKVEVQPRSPVGQSQGKNISLSPNAAAHLRALSNQVTDFNMKNALASLASRAREE